MDRGCFSLAIDLRLIPVGTQGTAIELGQGWACEDEQIGFSADPAANTPHVAVGFLVPAFSSRILVALMQAKPCLHLSFWWRSSSETIGSGVKYWTSSKCVIDAR